MLDVTTIVMIATFWTWNMLGSKPAIATIAVKDLNTGRKFYEVVLGLKPFGPTDSSEVVKYDAGTSGLLVYRSQYAGTNKATATTWIVGEDVEGTAETLKSNGVTFEHYELPPRLYGEGRCPYHGAH
jgi:predicted enzyme related to lactoylglutathione lyase